MNIVGGQLYPNTVRHAHYFEGEIFFLIFFFSNFVTKCAAGQHSPPAEIFVVENKDTAAAFIPRGGLVKENNNVHF